VKIYELEDNSFKDKNELYCFENILKGNVICIKTNIPCVVAKYKIEFERNDFLKGEFFINSIGENNIQERRISVHHTFKSFMYYFFR
jgi:hypothetical protein